VNLEMIGWREAILILVGLSVVYVLVALFRLVRVGKKGRVDKNLLQAAPVDTEFGKNDLEPALIVPELREPEESWQPISVEGRARQVARSTQTAVEEAPEPAVTASVARRPSDFEEQLAGQLARIDLEREVRSLRSEVEVLKAELKEMRAARNISPQYSEALALVQRGMTAQDIADRMEISLAEAELVHALGRGESIFEEGALDGSDREDKSLTQASSERY